MKKEKWNLVEVHNRLFKLNYPDADFPYLIGLERTPGAENRFVSHVYKGEYYQLEKGMCAKAYNRGPKSFSIWRNNMGLGICRNCLKATVKELNRPLPA